MTQGLLFGSGTSVWGEGIGTAFPITAPVESQKGSIAVTLTCHFARAMVSQPVSHRAFFRTQLIGLLSKARNPGRCIDALLRVCTTEGGPDGLDAAIDVLAKAGSLILDYAWEYLQWDIRNWVPSSERAYQPNDDCWYILLRAVGRVAVSEKERFRFISCCAHAESRGIREGVVEGLRDLGSRAAQDRIRQFADEDHDLFIRKIAREALDDLES